MLWYAKIRVLTDDCVQSVTINWNEDCFLLCFLRLSSEDGPASNYQARTHSDQNEDRLLAGTPGEDWEAAEGRVRWETRSGVQARHREGGMEIQSAHRAISLSDTVRDKSGRALRHSGRRVSTARWLRLYKGALQMPYTTGRPESAAHCEGRSDATSLIHNVLPDETIEYQINCTNSSFKLLTIK